MHRAMAILGVVGLAIGLAPVLANAEPLITAQEAALPAAPATGLTMRGVTRGPKIENDTPGAKEGTLKSPLELKLQFRSFGGATIDPASVKVTYLKSPAVDLTPRLKKFLKPDGIDMPGAELPAGQHDIRVDLKDSDGRSASTIFKLTVGP